MTQQGKILRTRVTDARPIGRNTQGVRLIRLDEPDRVVSVAQFVEKEEGGGSPLENAIEQTPEADDPEPPPE
jgi:DNA gyrase subunit A